MSKISKRFVSCVLAVAMMTSLAPSTAFATDGSTESVSTTTENSKQSAITVTSEDTLKTAITSAGSTTTTIQLGENITLNATLTIPENAKITLDLNGHTLGISSDIDVIDNSGTLTVKNGTIAAKDNGSTTAGMAVDNLAGATLTVDQDADKTTKLIGKCGIQNYGTVTVNNGTIESYNRNAYWGSGDSTLTVNDGTFTSPNGSSGYGRAISTEGDVTIYGGTFYSGGSSGAGDNYMNTIGMFNGAVLTIQPTDGKTVTVTSKTDYAVSSMGDATINIYGGTFACNGDRTDIYNFSDTNVVHLYGGTYKHEPYAEYLAEDRIVTKQDSGLYTVEELGETTSITVNSYDELKTALNGSATEPKNITLGQNITIPSNANLSLKSRYSITIPENITLTIEGILSLSGTLTNNGTLTVTDTGFIEYPLQITNTGTITDFPTVENEVCTISTPMQLQWLSCLIEWDNANIPANIELASDITMPDVNFTPIGNSSFYHESTFNGKNHTINNLKISVTSEYRGGFFGNVGDVTIKNLTINGTSTNSTSSYIGALAGYMGGSCTVQNVNISNYTVNSPISYGVGGFVGQIWTNDATDKVEFINCTSNANVTGFANVGGIWGTSTGSLGNIGIYNCTLGGSVTTINVNGAICGGYAASAPVTVIGLDHTDLTVTVKGQPTDNLLAYTTATNNLDNADASQYKAVKQNGTWTAIENSANTATADVSGVPYTSFDEAVKAAADGDIINITGEMTVNATVTIDKDITVTGFDKLKVEGDSLSIEAGTYDSDPTDYLAEGLKAKKIGNTYKVIDADIHTITFDANGGSCDTAAADTNGDGVLTTLPTATRDGYTFDGWFTAKDGGDKVTTETFFKEDITLYAHWTKNSSGGGTVTPTPDPEEPSDSEETVTNPDGSTTTTITKEDGSSSTTTVGTDGKVESDVTVSEEAVSNADGAAVALPIPEVPVTTDKDAAPTVTVNLPSKDATKVEVPVKDVTPGTVAVLVDADGNETVIKDTVQSENGIIVEITDGTTIKVVDNSKSFDDVTDNYWGADAIDFATSRELFAGTGENTFSPEGDMTRAMIWSVLARYEGADTSGASGDEWYAGPQKWAIENGISDGTYPNASMTREQLAAMLYRYVGSPAVSGTVGDYSDADSISSWAKDAMTWAVQEGLIAGMDNDTLNPQGTATRTQVAAILQRFIENKMA